MFADQIIAAVVNRFVTVSETFIPSCLLHFCVRLVEMFQKCNDCSELHYFSPL